MREAQPQPSSSTLFTNDLFRQLSANFLPYREPAGVPPRGQDGTSLAEMVSSKIEKNSKGAEMKRWTNTWAALIVAGFLTVPAAAQTPQTTAAPTTTATASSDQAQQGTPQEHLQKADAA